MAANKKLKSFSSFIGEQFPPPVVNNPPVNTASGSNIAGLPPDFPPVRSRKQTKMLKRRRKSV